MNVYTSVNVCRRIRDVHGTNNSLSDMDRRVQIRPNSKAIPEKLLFVLFSGNLL